MGKTFQRIHASSIGNFDNSTNKIPNWIIANGGTYRKEVTKGVTHLIATREAYTKNVPAVAEAKKLETVKIVSYDWLAESLLSKTRAPRPVKEYLWENILKNDNKKGRVAQMSSKKGQTGEDRKNQREAEPSVEDRPEDDKAAGGQAKRAHKRATQKEMGKKASSNPIKKRRKRRVAAKSTDPFDTRTRTARAQSIAEKHRQYEFEGLTYSAKLVRPFNNAQTTNEILYLKVYETIQSPHTYATHIKLTHRGSSKTECLAPLGSSLDTAMLAFKDCFRAQTGKEWEDRLNGVPPPVRKDKDGNIEPPNKAWFRLQSEQVSALASLFRD